MDAITKNANNMKHQIYKFIYLISCASVLISGFFLRASTEEDFKKIFAVFIISIFFMLIGLIGKKRKAVVAETVNTK